MTSYPLVSVIIPTNNRKKMLLRLIKSILAGTYQNVEIIIVDDASQDGTYEVIKENYSKKIKIIRNKVNLQTAASKNKGIKIARGAFLFFVDDDNIMPKNLIEKLVHELLSNKKLGEVGPVMYYYNNPKKVAWSQTKRDMLTTRIHARSVIDKSSPKMWYTDDIPNAFMVRRNIVNGEISFNAKLGIMYEEADYALKMRERGYLIGVIKNAKIYHDIPYIVEDRNGLLHTMQNKKRVYYIARNRLIFHAEHSTKLQLILILTFWNWLFMSYYIYNMLFYSGPGKYSFITRIKLVYSYIHGVVDGYVFAIAKL